MPRPYKIGLDYFPLDTDFFENKKIKNLRRAHGTIGILTYLNLLSRVYRNGYYFKFDDLEELAMDITEEIANTQLRATATSVTETINYLVGRGILAEGLFERGIISGVALQEQYVISAYKAKRNIKMDVHCLVDVWQVIEKIKNNSEETQVNSEETQVNSEFSTQSKSKSNVKVKTKDKAIALSEQTTTMRELESVPSDQTILSYFSERMLEEKAQVEAYRFKIYNEGLSWSCLPNWKSAADRWISNIGC